MNTLRSILFGAAGGMIAYAAGFYFTDWQWWMIASPVFILGAVVNSFFSYVGKVGK